MRTLNETERSICLDGLTDEQLALIEEATEGAMRALAIPGSGKTHTIVRLAAKIIFILRQNIEREIPPRLRMISFTRKAAVEAKERLGAIVGPAANRCVSTFHSLAMRVLADLHKEDSGPFGSIWPAKCGLRDPFREDVKWIGGRIKIHAEKFGTKDVTLEHCKDALMAACNSSEDMDELLSALHHIEKDETSPEENVISSVLSDLFVAYKRGRKIPIQIVIHVATSVLRTRGRGICKYLIVDEYQDTSADQAAFARALIHPYKNLIVVGDLHQAIYGWRGAVPENLDNNFFKHFPDAKTKYLTKNFRSTKNILQAARSVLEDFYQKEVKHCAMKKATEEKPVVLLSPSTSEEEFRAIVHCIREWKGGGRDWKDIFLLARNSSLFPRWIRGLMEEKIPYRTVRGDNFFGQKEVADMMAYFQWILNPRDVSAGRRAIAVPSRRIGDKWVETFGTDYTKRSWPESFRALEDMLKETHELALQKEPYSMRIFQEVIHRYGLGAYYEKSDKAQDSFDVMASWLSSFDHEKMSFKDALDELLILRHEGMREEKDADEDKVTIMSIHASKGLEAQCVFLAHVNNGILPSRYGDAKEECNLLYVGMTRAKEELIVSSPETVEMYGREERSGPSYLLEPLFDKKPDEGIIELSSDVVLYHLENNKSFFSSK